MSFKYSCFISYSSSQSSVQERFVNDFTESLRGQLGLYLDLPVFVDKERMKPGHSVSEQMAISLCESVCLVPILAPVYFHSRTCLMEYVAMEKLERERLTLLPEQERLGLIIPVILRGADALPQKVRERQYIDFSNYLPSDMAIDNQPAYSAMVQGIADYIFKLYQIFSTLPQDVSRNCSKFKLPKEVELDQWLGDESLNGSSATFFPR